MNTDTQICLLDELQSLLEKQIELTRQGNINDVEILGEQAGFLVEKIARSGVLELPEFKNLREKLQKSYEDLCLALTAHKADAARELSQVRKGKKTIGTYRRNI